MPGVRACHSWPGFGATASPTAVNGREPDGELAVRLRKLK
jgi:hypothetical protein